MRKYYYLSEDEEDEDIKANIIAFFIVAGMVAALLLASKMQYEHEGKTNHKQAIIYGKNTATIVDIKHTRIEGTFTYIETKNGMKLEVPTNSVQIVYLDDSPYTAEDIAIYTMGEDVDITYLFDPEEQEIGNNSSSLK